MGNSSPERTRSDSDSESGSYVGDKFSVNGFAYPMTVTALTKINVPAVHANDCCLCSLAADDCAYPTTAA